MKVTLVYPYGRFDEKYKITTDVSSERKRVIAQHLRPIPPAGIGYMAAELMDHGINVDVIDGFAELLATEEIVSRIKAKKPDAVGISCLCAGMHFVKNLSEAIKAEVDTKVIIGGTHPTIYPGAALELCGSIDIGVSGEGEKVFPQIIDSMDDKVKLGKINGISFRKGRQVIVNEGINRVDKLDELCYPAWYKFKIKKYPGIYKERGKSLLPIFASRGCFGRCSFCATLDSLAKNSYRIRSPKCVAEELEYMVEKYKVSNFLFNDPCFPVQEKFVEELSKEIVDRGLNDKIIWMAETRIQKIPRSTFKMMYKSGCRIIAFGIESGNQEILDRINKNIKLDEIRRAVGNAKSEGLDVISSFMVGLPGDTKETIKETLNFAKELRVTQAFFSPTMLLPNTQIFEEAVKQGRIDKDFWKNYVLTGGDIPLNLEKDFTREELINIVQNAYRSFFLQPRIIANYLMKLKDSSSIKMYIKYAESIVKKKYSGI